MIAIGLMSGSSLDGIDAARVRIVPTARGYEVALERFETLPLAPDLHESIVRAIAPHAAAVPQLAALHVALGGAFGEAARAVADDLRIDYVASHGQTIFHDGAAHVSWQLGDAFALREKIDATVVYDFRSADCAAGGGGAPLVPYVDALLLAADEPRIALNLGGIANLTFIPPGALPADVLAFDSGPANMLVDLLVAERTRGALRFDRGGERARRGAVDQALLHEMLDDPYFALDPPKSTGRERFGPGFLAAHPRIDTLSIDDGAATLLALSITSIAAAVRRIAPLGTRLVVSGGGARNHAFVDGLRGALDGFPLVTSGEFGIDPDAKEALAFAVLGYETLRGRAAGLPRVTGARHPAVLGAVAPRRLEELLALVRKEETMVSS
ncbi:MAG TPA: anhydro-N-acetylmuramic acid kinase [Candidatus Binatia bacterium]|nr:anhydro-N-acetylmuramic acid kinase [Candidatus Binatia bacterium]